MIVPDSAATEGSWRTQHGRETGVRYTLYLPKSEAVSKTASSLDIWLSSDVSSDAVCSTDYIRYVMVRWRQADCLPSLLFPT